MRFRNIVRAEFSKLRTLPAAALTCAGTVFAGAVTAAAVAAVDVDEHGATSPVAATTAAIPFVQAGIILLGILPFTQEYAGRHIHTTLIAVPRRWPLLAAKTIVAQVASAIAGAITVGASVAAAAVTAGLRGAPIDHGLSVWQAVGAVSYLTLIGLFAHVVATLVRQVIPALVIVVGMALIVSPMLARYPEYVRWLPDRAGMQLYQSTDNVLTPVTGGLVLVAWIVGIATAAAARFVSRDA